MALKLENYENEQGQKIEYWRIGRIFISFADKIVNIYMQGYVNQEARLNNKMYVEERIFNLPDIETIQNEDGTTTEVEHSYPFNDDETDTYSLRPLLYTELKKYKFFENAIDC